MEKAGGTYSQEVTAIGQEIDGELVVGVAYTGYTGASITMSSRCDNPAKVGRKFYWMIFDYVFKQLQLKRAYAMASEKNTKAQKVNEHLGFQRMATLPDFFPDGDAVIYSMRPDECRWLALEKQYGK
jgi:Tol biopolymer transport system component